MENSKNKLLTGTLLVGLLLISNTGKAGLGDKFNKYIGSEFTNMSGFYIILGVLGVGIVGKLFHYFFMREDNEKVSNVKISHTSHHRHHRPRPLVKKTS